MPTPVAHELFFQSCELFMSCVIVLGASITMSFGQSMIEMHMIHKLDVDEVEVGIAFSIVCLVYTVISILVGQVWMWLMCGFLTFPWIRRVTQNPSLPQAARLVHG